MLYVSNYAPLSLFVGIFACTCYLACSSAIASDDDDQLHFMGDFRYRYEKIDLKDEGLDARTRHRIRARFGLEARPADGTRLVFQIATGSDDLVSSNQTLTRAFSSKNVVLDLAYGEYLPIVFKGRLTLVAGKSILQTFRPGATELLWDSDLRPEGLSAHFDLGSDKVDFRILVGHYILEERENDDNSILRAGQIVGTIRTFTNLSSLKAGIGYFHFTQIEGRTPFFRNNFYGNSFFTDTTFPANTADPPVITLKHQHDYREVELFVEAGFSWRKSPILLMADYVVNTKPETNNTGWLVGLKVGEITQRGAWSIRYNYRQLEADAVYGTFTDSNFKGGGTDGKGHEIELKIGTAKHTSLSLSYLHNWEGIDNGDKYQRWMLDVTSTFK